MAAVKAGSRPPWIGLAAAVWVQVASGNAYTFPLYSHSLKSVLGYSQQQLTILGVANDFGENFGMIPGVLCNRFPPWLVLLIGGACCFLGYGVVWLAVTRTLEGVPYWLAEFSGHDKLGRYSSKAYVMVTGHTSIAIEAHFVCSKAEG